MKKENASLRAEKEILQQSATVASQKLEETKNEVVQLKKEMASLQAKTEGLTKELEKKRDENRQWRDHADILESGRMKAQQEADTWREKARIAFCPSVASSVLSSFLFSLAERMVQRP